MLPKVVDVEVAVKHSFQDEPTLSQGWKSWREEGQGWSAIKVLASGVVRAPSGTGKGEVGPLDHRE